MQDKPTQPSSPEDYGAATIFVTLPISGPGGKPLVAEIEAATLEELIPMMKGITGLGRDQEAKPPDDPLEVTLNFVRRQGETARPMIERFVKHPRISFDGPQQGMVEWRSLHLINRLALVNAVSEYAQSGSVRRAERLATFLADDERGGRNGGDSGVSVSDGRASAPEVSIAT